MEDQLSDDQRQKMLQFMATEHSVLQAGRSATIFETGGRTAVFLGTVSSTLVALALIGQISRLGTAFFAFALVLLPTLFFLGLVTFERALELGIEDYIYAAGMSRIRHFYVEMVPQAEKYFVGSIHDDLATTMAPHRLQHAARACMVAIVPHRPWRHSGGKRCHRGLLRGPARASGRRRDAYPQRWSGHSCVRRERVVTRPPPRGEVAANRGTLTAALSQRRGSLI
jgi:hypothetical protein